MRPMSSDDGPELAELLAASPDTGLVRTAPVFQCDPLLDYYSLSGDIEGIVAETSKPRTITGAGLIRYGQCNYEGSTRAYAYLHALAVRPCFRRQGIGKKLVRSLVRRARDRTGPAGVVLAFVQSKNKGSLRTFRNLPMQLKSRLILVPVRKKKGPPSPLKGIAVHKMEIRYLKDVAGALNDFYKDYNLYQKTGTREFRDWQERKIGGQSYRHYLVAVNNASMPVAGIGVAEEHLIRTLRVKHMPLPYRLINRLFKFLPENGVVRPAMIEKVWFSNGNFEVARHLIEHAGWKWGGEGRSLFALIDKKVPLVRLFALKSRILNSSYTIAIDATPKVSSHRLIYPM